jgi:hypothetical protein
MSNKDHHTPTKKYSDKSGNNDERNKRKLKEEEGNTALSKSANSKSTDDDHTNEPTIIRPLPLKYTKVSILPSHLKFKRKRKISR